MSLKTCNSKLLHLFLISVKLHMDSFIRSKAKNLAMINLMKLPCKLGFCQK